MRHRLSLSADVIEKVVVLSTLFAAPAGATGAAADKVPRVEEEKKEE